METRPTSMSDCRIRPVGYGNPTYLLRNLVFLYQMNMHVLNEILRRQIAPQDDVNCSGL
jgi:hypothetical protein